MATAFIAFSLVCWICVQVNSLKIDSKILEVPEKKELPEDATVALRAMKSTYEVNFEGLNKPVKVDCDQEGVICKFPLWEERRESAERRKVRRPSEKSEHVPIFSGVVTQSKDNQLNEKEEENKLYLVAPKEESKRVPLLKGSFDIESLYSDGKTLDSVTGNFIPDKGPINVYHPRYPNTHIPSVYFMYHSPYDYSDHIGSGPYHYPLVQPMYRWNPFTRPETNRNPHVVTNAPCDPPVYHYQPPPCSSGVRPTVKPVINIDDKLDNH